MLMLLLPGATAVMAQSYKPALEYASLMNPRFCEANFLELVFPPPGVRQQAPGSSFNND